MTKPLLALATMLIASATAFAHAVLVEAAPPARGHVSGPTVVFRLRFNSRIDAARSTLELVNPDRSVRLLPMGKQPSPDVLSSTADQVKNGRYTLRWQVLAADGHITRGEVPFEVR